MVRILRDPDADTLARGAPAGGRAELQKLFEENTATAGAGIENIRTDPRQAADAIGRLSDALVEESVVVGELLQRVEDGHADAEDREALVEQAEVLKELADVAEEAAVGERPPEPRGAPLAEGSDPWGACPGG